MKRFYSLSLAALLVALMAGFGPNGTVSAQTNDQNAETNTSKETNANEQSGGLKQTTGIPFQVTPPTQDTLPLLAIMVNMEQNMAALQAGIWRGDYQTIKEAANALTNHAKIPKREIQKIETILGKDGLKNFVAADKFWHKKTKELAKKANNKDMEQIVNLTAEVFQRCAGCHVKYREPLRNSPKWRER